ncbi:Optic atrophy 3 protein, putative [Pediculus humanus corporis]|uniref:Optic atrophy 3 protein, putative n=1 Tax=Pediculus humanus subsp. corporis TaxID=121224 RepID=E0VYI9_PEDHC|nr:Optic atrophy 3 protein, putative [Pediculus humanus corporis]EEB18445.1 Optic atrophy 3 protein, putative [Pediculus humanus corporis]
MVAAFPLAKIGLLLMKQLSKPLANLIKNEAKKHPLIRRYVIIPTGKAYHWVETQAMSKEKSSVMNLTEDEVVELGSNAIGEIVLFGLLTIILLAEYNRQGEQKAVKQKMKEDEIANLITTVVDTIEDVNDLKYSVKQIEKKITDTFDALVLDDESFTSHLSDDNFLDVFTQPKKSKWFFQSSKKSFDDSSPTLW